MYADYIKNFNLNYPVTLPVEINNPEDNNQVENYSSTLQDIVVIKNEKDLQILALEMDDVFMHNHYLETGLLGEIEVGYINSVDFYKLEQIGRKEAS